MQPYHAALGDLVAERIEAVGEPVLVAIHSFNPTYRGIERPWHIGVVHDDDRRVADRLIDGLRALRPDLVTADNEPYSPADRVYYTLERHARSQHLPCVMIEVRNDLIAEGETQDEIAGLLARALEGAVAETAPEAGQASARHPEGNSHA